ncbi:hypothetical protein IPM09_00640 [Candidatus Saccharibacteria bacterium]|nr:MAG: hypothetical protein IPM09_00640 [Candidatus Saccharibacteria bacterium]
MSKRILVPLVLAALLVAVPITFASSVAYARDSQENIAREQENEMENETENETEHSTADNREKVTVEVRKERFEANKLRVCEKRQEQIKSMIEKVSSRGTKQLEVFKKIADKTKQFYTDKKLSDPGYAALVGEVDAAYTSASSAVSSTTTTGNSWTCNGENPKQAMTDFKAAKKNEIAQLKAYKDKVRALIVLVKKAAGASSTTNTSEEVR